MKSRLIATDIDPELLHIYRLYFSNLGFKVATASDGLECVKLLRKFAPDALILSLDLCWGGADGVLAVIREESPIRNIPVVLTVADLKRSRAADFLFPPVVRLFEKPFRLTELCTAITAAVCTPLECQVDGAPYLPDSYAQDSARIAIDSDDTSPATLVQTEELHHA